MKNPKLHYFYDHHNCTPSLSHLFVILYFLIQHDRNEWIATSTFLTSFLLFGLCYDGSFYYFFFLQILYFPIYHARNQLIAISPCLSFLTFAFCYYHSFYYLFFCRVIFIRRQAFGVGLWRRLRIMRNMEVLLDVTKWHVTKPWHHKREHWQNP